MRTIQSLHPITDDWFVVENNDDRWCISRISAWALCPPADERSEFAMYPFTDGSVLSSGLDDQTYFYVNGLDSSPEGSAWSDLYRLIKPTAMNRREITGQVKDILNARWDQALKPSTNNSTSSRG